MTDSHRQIDYDSQSCPRQLGTLQKHHVVINIRKLDWGGITEAPAEPTKAQPTPSQSKSSLVSWSKQNFILKICLEVVNQNKIKFNQNKFKWASS